MKNKFKDYFSFNSRERVAMLLLCLLIACFWILPFWYPQNQKITIGNDWKNFAKDSSNDNKLQSDKYFYNYSSSKHSLKADSSGIAIHPKLFVFNPNTISEAGWRKMGLNEKLIQTILHYLQKGGYFKSAGDIRKIWGMSPELASQLIPFIEIPENQNHRLNNHDLIKNNRYLKTNAIIPIPVKINEAKLSDLLMIPGFNRSLAARMIKFRDKIGGFITIEQVRKTYGLNDSLFQLMQPYILL